MSTSYTVSMDVTVHDEQALWDAAAVAYVEDAGSHVLLSEIEDLLGTREEPDIPACLQMLLDPGESPAGCTVEESRCE